MSVPTLPTSGSGSPPSAPDRGSPPPGPASTLRSADPASTLLDGLEALVRRHRALRTESPDTLHTELITAEVAQHLAVARTALRRRPRAV
ncbi:hypothetical protein [Pseudonocardia sp. HH130630-07]|uniref:hypothetical protein n=1 Tax=Pseudonocardia sp. HH130630-07 TaxID=1690815 RepID=UPI0008153A94|nr:hypothetical protein [Pseudonocardia sp. HH130630-07]ANY08541.1 hypothetical protein AFB00_22245 [Pseudonocardia sp. HH130630-07]